MKNLNFQTMLKWFKWIVWKKYYCNENLNNKKLKLQIYVEMVYMKCMKNIIAMKTLTLKNLNFKTMLKWLKWNVWWAPAGLSHHHISISAPRIVSISRNTRISKNSVLLKILEVKYSTEISNKTTPIVTQPFIEKRIKSIL